MKKFLVIVVGFILLSNFSYAQYKVNKTKYDVHNYSRQAGDPYNPTLAGLESFLVPGLGQALAGETKRGLIFFGSYVGCWAIYGIGAHVAARNIANGGTGGAGWGLVAVGAIGAGVVGIWSIFDAVKVAKINDLAYREKQKTALSLKVQPYFGSNIPVPVSNNRNMPVGISLIVGF